MKLKLGAIFNIREKLLEKGVSFITPAEFQRIFKLSRVKTKYFLEANTRRGIFIRVKRGLYALKNNFPNEEITANILYKPSYISLEYALAKYDILPEMVQTITSVTTKPTRTFEIHKKIFLYYTIKRQAYTGYIPIKIGVHTVFIAEPEKALVDYLYFISLGKKSYNDRLNVTRLDRKKILYYAKLYRRPSMMKLIEKYDKR